MNHYSPDYRIGDVERQRAMDDLGTHFAAGRLDIEEYERRISTVAGATMTSELIAVFDDLPAPEQVAAQQLSPREQQQPEKFYSASELDQAYQSGRRMRAGIVGLSTMLTLGAQAVFGAYEAPYFLLVAAISFIMLYLLKLGPTSWHTPSPRTLERQRMKHVRMIQMEELQQIRLANEQFKASQKALQKQKQAEIANAAMDLTSEALKRLRKKG